MLGIAPEDPDMADDDGNAATEEAKKNPPRQQRQPAPPKQEDREPPADPRGKAAETITLHWPDGKTREFPRTIAGAKEFVKAAKSAVATNREIGRASCRARACQNV